MVLFCTPFGFHVTIQLSKLHNPTDPVTVSVLTVSRKKERKKSEFLFDTLLDTMIKFYLKDSLCS